MTNSSTQEDWGLDKRRKELKEEEGRTANPASAGDGANIGGDRRRGRREDGCR